MTRKLLVISLFLFLGVFASSVNAETSTTVSAQTTVNPPIRVEQRMPPIQSQRQVIMPQTRIDLKQQITDTIRTKREELRVIVASREAEFKAKLLTIKDVRKKAALESIDAKLSSTNTKYTDRFTVVLGNLQTILDKISADVDKTQAIAAISAAKTAVENQAAKTYSLTITTEDALKMKVGPIVSQFRQDINATYKTVVSAKQAVQKLSIIKPVIEKSASESANL